MDSPTQTCPSCGARTGGKFCSECGAPLSERACPECGAKLSARAKFCPECGSPVAPRTTRSGPGPRPAAAGGPADRAPWVIAGIAVLALLVVVVVVIGPGGSGGGGPAAGDQAGEFPGRATTDLSRMSPREQADRLFDRVARATEAGDAQQVQFFGPMALQAYTMLGALDADARLHVGLIQIALNAPAAAHAQADTIQRASRTHLYAALLRARAAELEGDSAAAHRAYRSFLANYDAERAKNLPEYDQHLTMLEQTRAEAQRLIGGGASR